jgi:hypothetical protein
MVTVVEAPNKDNVDGFKVFLAGGITSCPNWQKSIIDKLKGQEKNIKENIILFNPRRENFPIHDPNAANEQIKWEYDKLKESDMIIFWFSRGSLNPIVLYELGMWGNSRDIPIIIGIDEGYERKQDVEIQTKLAKPDVLTVYNLDDMVSSMIDVFKKI